jgi:hypothetical protein
VFVCLLEIDSDFYVYNGIMPSIIPKSYFFPSNFLRCLKQMSLRIAQLSWNFCCGDISWVILSSQQVPGKEEAVFPQLHDYHAVWRRRYSDIHCHHFNRYTKTSSSWQYFVLLVLNNDLSCTLFVINLLFLA